MSGKVVISGGTQFIVQSGALMSAGPSTIDWNGWDGSNNTSPTSFDIAASEVFPTAFATLDTDKYIVGFTRDSPQNPSVLALSRSGDTITAGAVNILDTDRPINLNNWRVNASDTDRAIAIYAGDNGATDNRHGRILTVSGTTVTANAEQLINSDSDVFVQLAKLDTDKHLYIFTDTIAPQGVRCQVFTNSGTTTFTSGNKLALKSPDASGSYCNYAKLPGVEKVVVAYKQTDNGGTNVNGFHLHVVSVSGTTSSTGATITIPSSPGATDEIINLIPIDATHVALLYSGSNSGGTTYIRIYSISGTTLTQEVGQTVLLNVRLKANGDVNGVLSEANNIQLNNTDFMISHRVDGGSVTNAYVISFPTPTTHSIIATAEIDGTNELKNIMLQSIDATTIIMVSKDPGDSSAILARLLKL